MQSGVSVSVNSALFSGTYGAAEERKVCEVNPVSSCLRQTRIWCACTHTRTHWPHTQNSVWSVLIHCKAARMIDSVNEKTRTEEVVYFEVADANSPLPSILSTSFSPFSTLIGCCGLSGSPHCAAVSKSVGATLPPYAPPHPTPLRFFAAVRSGAVYEWASKPQDVNEK